MRRLLQKERPLPMRVSLSFVIPLSWVVLFKFELHLEWYGVLSDLQDPSDDAEREYGFRVEVWIWLLPGLRGDGIHFVP